ncbi:MAG: Gfo/Idh/MocA family oxidoreductase [Verrucomicrobiota bacterium]
MKAPQPSRSSRRQFLQKTTSAWVAGTALTSFPSLTRANANERFTMAVVGPGGMGTNLLKSFTAQKDVDMAYVCDADRTRTEQAAKNVEEISKKRPKTVGDMRRVFEDKSVDAVVVATPDHWHAPATILACEAGKHVYVEKPCAHNIREGRLMIEAARRHQRIVQVGTQSRSNEFLHRAMELLHNGAIGDILVSKAWNSQLRRSIGKQQPTKPPEHLDFDLWLGPAPAVPYQSNLLHSIWRWWFAFGTGDMGNDGVHDIDIARWGLGVTTHPNRIAALGGKFFFDDDQQFPDTQYVVFEYGEGAPGKRRQLIFEQRIWSPYFQEGAENGNAFYGTKGMMILSKGSGWQLFGPRNEPREKMSGKVDGLVHHRNFLECIRSGKHPNADIEIGHLSASLCHLGNIATRLGRTLNFDPQKEQIVGDAEANQLVRRTYREHWAVPKGV